MTKAPPPRGSPSPSSLCPRRGTSPTGSVVAPRLGPSGAASHLFALGAAPSPPLLLCTLVTCSGPQTVLRTTAKTQLVGEQPEAVFVPAFNGPSMRSGPGEDSNCGFRGKTTQVAWLWRQGREDGDRWHRDARRQRPCCMGVPLRTQRLCRLSLGPDRAHCGDVPGTAVGGDRLPSG